MSISDLSGFISSIAVLATLILLLLQMQQTNRNQKALMQQGRSARITAQQAVTTEPTLAAAMVRGFASDTSLDPLQVRMINAFIQAFFWSHEDSFLQHKAGLLDEATWASDLASIRTALSAPAFRVGWKMARFQTGGVYRDFVDGQLHEVKVRKAFDEAAIWKRLMEKEIADAV
jgi:hypothetical protein